MNLRYRVFAQLETGGEMHSLTVTDGASLKAIADAVVALSAPVEADPLERFKKLPRRPGRPVRVVRYHEGRGYAEPAYVPKVGEEFESLTDFAEAVGTSVGNASVQISAARRSGRATAVVRGVEYGYVDELARRLTEPPSSSGELVGRTLATPPPSEAAQPPPRSPLADSIAAPRRDPEQAPTPAIEPAEPRKPKIVLRVAGPRPENHPPPASYAPEADLPEPPAEVQP